MKCINCKYLTEEVYPDFDMSCDLAFSIDYDNDGDYSCNHTEEEMREREAYIEECDKKMLKELEKEVEE